MICTMGARMHVVPDSSQHATITYTRLCAVIMYAQINVTMNTHRCFPAPTDQTICFIYWFTGYLIFYKHHVGMKYCCISINIAINVATLSVKSGHTSF